ncbi:MAG: SDR family NAD(P)-dependent oxidoreductase [Chloroflexota bacterium]
MKPNVLLIGANSAIGQAIAHQLVTDFQVHTLSRDNTDYSEFSLTEHAVALAEYGAFRYIINCIGILHDEVVSPEKSLRQIEAEKLAHYYHINTILPALCIKHFHGLLNKEATSVFASLSAMVGSIGDNHLGGWYGYRSSKAALNMITKTASIEIGRKNKHACLVSIHPGTTISNLSAPFARSVKPDKYYTPAQSAARILDLLSNIGSEDNGSFFHWNGEEIEW